MKQNRSCKSKLSHEQGREEMDEVKRFRLFCIILHHHTTSMPAQLGVTRYIQGSPCLNFYPMKTKFSFLLVACVILIPLYDAIVAFG
jgi:hypothetical protein